MAMAVVGMGQRRERGRERHPSVRGGVGGCRGGVAVQLVQRETVNEELQVFYPRRVHRHQLSDYCTAEVNGADVAEGAWNC